MSATAKNWNIKRAPSRIELLGDKTKRPESAQHIIEFPGGAIELSRTDDGNYWAHIIVHEGEPQDWDEGRQSARGEILGSRIDDGKEVRDFVSGEGFRQVAVLIKPHFRLKARKGAHP